MNAVAELLSEGWIDAVAQRLGEAHFADAADGVARLTVSGTPSGSVTFCVVMSQGHFSVVHGKPPRPPDMALTWSYADFVAMCTGGISIEAAYMSGRMKLEGDQVLLFDGWRPLFRSTEMQEALSSQS